MDDKYLNRSHTAGNEELTPNYGGSKQEAILIVKYNVTDADNPTQLYAYRVEGGVVSNAASMFNKVVIDGTEVSIADLDVANGQTQLSEGEHTVKYTLKDPTFIGIDGDTSSIKVGATFAQCTSIVSVSIPNSVTNVGVSTFNSCSSLSSITIPNGVTSIGNAAFAECSGLLSITIGSGITSIDNNAFHGCGNLENIISLAKNAPSIGDLTFNDHKVKGTLTVPRDSSGYDLWLTNLGSEWTKVEQ